MTSDLLKRSAPWLLGAALLMPAAVEGQDVATPQQACNDGDPAACHELGTMFLTGAGVERDPLRAAVYYERACSQEAMPACAALGLMHLRGEGVALDRRRALDLLGRACDAEDGSACAQLGTLYANGRTIERDLEQAADYFRRACDFDDLSGCANLGILYERGAGVEADTLRARELFRATCRDGLAAACSFLTSGSWELTAYEPDDPTPRATIRTRSAAGAPATLSISCTPEQARVTLDWTVSAANDAPELTTRIGSEATEAEDWSFDQAGERFSYQGDARAFIAGLAGVDQQALFASDGVASASFTLSGLDELMLPLTTACGW